MPLTRLLVVCMKRVRFERGHPGLLAYEA
jgi:hypothetical protein